MAPACALVVGAAFALLLAAERAHGAAPSAYTARRGAHLGGGVRARRASALRATTTVPPPATSPSADDDDVAAMLPLDAAEPMRVGLIVEPTPFTHISGYANRFNEMLRFLRRAGDDVSIVTPDDTSEAPEEAHGYKITTVSGFRFPLYPICLSVDPDCGAKRMVETHRPTILHSSSPSFLMSVSIALSWLYRLPLMLSYHTHLPVYAREYLRPINWFGWLEKAAWAFIRWQHNQADLTLTTSPQLAQELRENGVRNVEVWPKGVDTIKFSPEYRSAAMRERLGGVDAATGAEVPLLLYVGRVCESKRIQQLKATLRDVPNARLAIVGGGPSLPRMEETFAAEVGAGRVRFLGIMRGAELSAAFASADVFVLPSDSETLGFVVLESMVSARAHARAAPGVRRRAALTAAPPPSAPAPRPQASGVPPVGVRAGGVPDLVSHGETGLLAAPGDEGAAEFTEHVRTLLQDRPLREAMGKAARAEAERWSWEAATAKLRNDKYTKAIARHRKAMEAAGIESGLVRPRTWPRPVVWAVTGYILLRVRARPRPPRDGAHAARRSPRRPLPRARTRPPAHGRPPSPRLSPAHPPARPPSRARSDILQHDHRGPAAAPARGDGALRVQLRARGRARRVLAARAHLCALAPPQPRLRPAAARAPVARRVGARRRSGPLLSAPELSPRSRTLSRRGLPGRGQVARIGGGRPLTQAPRSRARGARSLGLGPRRGGDTGSVPTAVVAALASTTVRSGSRSCSSSSLIKSSEARLVISRPSSVPCRSG